jgi:hypothetical protein
MWLYLLITDSDIIEFVRRKSGLSYEPVSKLSEIESLCSNINADGIFGNGVVAVALGLFPPASADSGRVSSGYSYLLL